MSDLDNRLREILLETYNSAYLYEGRTQNYTTRKLKSDISQIKQAFADEGYVLFFESGNEFNDDYARKKKQLEVQHKRDVEAFRERMTGQEWYNRFEKELGEPEIFVGYGYDSVGYEDDRVLNAAKKASGL